MFVTRQVTFFRKIADTFSKRGKDILPEAKFCVGRDHFGNQYFEVPKGPGKRPARISSLGLTNYISAEEKIDTARGNFDARGGQNKIPVEWQQWMRHTRKDPPTEHELLMNEAIHQRTLMRAQRVKIRDDKAREEQEARRAAEKEDATKNLKDEFYVNPEDEVEEWTPGGK